VFQKLVAIEPVSLEPWAQEKLRAYAGQVTLFEDVPGSNEEIVRRAHGADALLLSYTSRLDREVLERCPALRYVGMCCSLYSKESANVDIACAEERGITVTGIRDYGDRGVVEYVLCELVRFLHGYDRPLWRGMPEELTGLPVGMVGLGVSGGMVAEALQSMGAEISYFCRSPKERYEAMGMRFTALRPLLKRSQAVICCLNKNVLLLGREEFDALGTGKLLFNTSIGPAFQPRELERWLDKGGNLFACDTLGALGDESLARRGDVFCVNASAGRTRQAFGLLSEKVLANIEAYLACP